MQAASSAKRTCNESRSTSLWTATVRIPISLQVQIMRQAISPRLAINIFLNFLSSGFISCPKSKVFLPQRTLDFGPWTLELLFDAEEWLPILNRLSILDVNLRYFTRSFSL